MTSFLKDIVCDEEGNVRPVLKRKCGLYGELAKLAFKSHKHPCPVCGRRLGEETSFDKDIMSFTQWKRWCNRCNYKEDYDHYTGNFTMQINEDKFNWCNGISDKDFAELSKKIKESMVNYKLKLDIAI